jgi:hypothetical protein
MIFLPRHGQQKQPGIFLLEWEWAKSEQIIDVMMIPTMIRWLLY